MSKMSFSEMSEDIVEANSSSNLTVSSEERKRYLEELQSETTEAMIAALPFLALIAVLGFVGNTLVIVVYSRRKHWSGTGVLIMTLAGFDLVANVIAIPGEIYNLLNRWDFHMPVLCKARLFCSAFTTISSAMILVAIAVVRYRRMCHPHKWQITADHAKAIAFVIFSLGLWFASPHALLNGLQIRETPRKGIMAFSCGTTDNFKNTILPFVNYIFLMMHHCVSSTIMIVLYILIGIAACKGGEALTTPLLPMLDSPIETINPGTDAFDTPVDRNRNESNCTRCASPYNKNIDPLISGKDAIQSARNVDENNTKQFLVGNEANEHPVQYYLRIFTDRIEVWTPAVRNFFVNLQKKTPGNADSTNHERSLLNNADKGRGIQKGSPGEVRASEIKIIASNNSNIKIRTLKSNLGDIVSNLKYTEKRIDEFLDKENKLEAAKTMDTTAVTLNLKELSVTTGSICDQNVLNLNVVDNDRDPPQSLETAVNKILKKSDPWSMPKWLDFIYCPEDEHTTFDPNCVEKELSFFLRPPLNDDLLQQTEWLRVCVIESLESENKTSNENPRESFLGPSTSVDKSRSQASCSHSVVGADSATTGTAPSDLNKNVLNRRFHEKFFHRMSLITMGGNTANSRPVMKTTTILFIITAVYIFSYLPHLAIMFVKFTSPGVTDNLSLVTCIFYNLFARTYFLNSAVNPIIYSLCNVNFRQECLHIFRITKR